MGTKKSQDQAATAAIHYLAVWGLVGEAGRFSGGAEVVVMLQPESKSPGRVYLPTQIHPSSSRCCKILGRGQAERDWAPDRSILPVSWVAGTIDFYPTFLVRDLLPRLSELEGHENSIPPSGLRQAQEKIPLATPLPFQLASKFKSLQDLDVQSLYLLWLGSTYLPCRTTHHALGHAKSFFFFFTLDDMTDFPSPLLWDLGFFPVH